MALTEHIQGLLRRRQKSEPAWGAEPALQERVWSELVADLPDEDLGEDLEACLEDYEMGSKPRCEEAEYLALVQDAIDRIADGGRGSSKRKGRIHGGGAPWVRRGRFRAS